MSAFYATHRVTPIRPHFQTLPLTLQPVAAVLDRQPRWRCPRHPIATLLSTRQFIVA